MVPSDLTEGFIYLVDSYRGEKPAKAWCKENDVGYSTLNNIRKGRIDTPSMHLIFDVARALGVPPWKIVWFCEEYYHRKYEHGKREE